MLSMLYLVLFQKINTVFYQAQRARGSDHGAQENIVGTEHYRSGYTKQAAGNRQMVPTPATRASVFFLTQWLSSLSV